jgi:2-keto-4-pentenoate hydratase/2-oxohepta-3-ene-1,7-dioic acid hydratase in catechol pathway
MTYWIRFRYQDQDAFGTLEGDTVTRFEGNMFGAPQPQGGTLALADVHLLPPTRPTKMIAIWNNFRAAADKNGWAIPEEPLYLIKPPSCFLGSGEAIRRPRSYDGRVVFEGELGVVIGRRCTAVSLDEARANIFGYTCVNDVTALELINRDPAFAQWTRAKSFDTFGVFGPVVATGLDAADLVVRVSLNGRERQNYPIADAVFPPEVLVSRISECMTLEPGDIIACGTSLGVAPMKAGATVEVTIDGIGTLRNHFEG